MRSKMHIDLVSYPQFLQWGMRESLIGFKYNRLEKWMQFGEIEPFLKAEAKMTPKHWSSAKNIIWTMIDLRMVDDVIRRE